MTLQAGADFAQRAAYCSRSGWEVMRWPFVALFSNACVMSL